MSNKENAKKGLLKGSFFAFNDVLTLESSWSQFSDLIAL